VLLTAALLLLLPHRLPAEAAALLSLVTADEIEAVSFVDKGTASSRILKPAVENNRQAPPLFGMETEPVIAGDVLEKWTHAKAAIDQELDAVAQCGANGVCSPAAQRLIDLSASGAGRSGRARVGLINRAVDLAISPADDEAQWGVQDHWNTPFETLWSSRGDCEDYAIVKYLALRSAGMSQDDVKIVILKNVFPD